jgi:hypothetical protein
MFERLMQQYVLANISDGIYYFSIIRQLSSVAVAKLFAQHKDYYEVFTSDNYVFRIKEQARPSRRWSTDSPKSLSSFILLAPWVEPDDMLRIFGADLLDNAALEPLFLRLIGVEGEPPLDCVGTVEELRLSLQLANQQHKFSASPLMQVAEQHGVLANASLQPELAAALSPQSEHALPDELVTPINDYLKTTLAT